MKSFRKQPRDRLDYDFLFSRWLIAGDAISSVQVDAPNGIEYEGVAFTDTAIKVWVSGGTSGQSYPFAVRAITNQGRVKEVDFMITVVEI